ncbi:MAG: 16S rRNA (guanine(527)-N(7))-methyltransferase RsmG [Betaproteobacteria bacterium]
MTDLMASLSLPLDQGLDRLDLEVPPPARRLLVEYLALIDRWNRVYNLTAVRNPADMLVQHLLDSLAVVIPLRRHLQAEGRASGPEGPVIRMLDVGSGAGLPGVVLAIVEPTWDVTCVDAVAKKASFIRQVAAELGIPNLRAHHARVEDLPAPSVFDLVTSRAFASLTDFVSLTGYLLSATGVWMAMKGKAPEDEVADLPDGVEVFHVEQLTVPSLEAQRCLVWMRRMRT